MPAGKFLRVDFFGQILPWQIYPWPGIAKNSIDKDNNTSNSDIIALYAEIVEH